MVKTGAIFKNFIFDGVNSADYGVYITGAAVYNAPVRDVEMIEIPGRNGAFALDNGRFANITVTYPAGMYGVNETDFATAISDLRNALASRKGYCRLTDEYNPNEYRMAVYKSGLEVTPAQLKAGEFEITFDCKPQRFLTSGETQQNVTSGATITNPTLFESHPLLLVDGYGNIDINGESITIQQGAVMGETLLDETINATSFESGVIAYFRMTRNVNNMNVALSGDGITLGASLFSFMLKNVVYTDFIVTSTSWQDDGNSSVRLFPIQSVKTPIQVSVTVGNMSFVKGTSSAIQFSPTFECDWLSEDSMVAGEDKGTVNINVSYDGNSTFLVSLAIQWQGNHGLIVDSKNNWEAKGYTSTVDSTKSALGNLYIDLDIGECYRIENGEYISINTATTLPADLPTLKPGANVITYPNTFTSFKVTPRWFKI